MLYLAGKGDGNIRYFECVNHNDKVDSFPLSEYRTSVAAKGVAFMPKRGLNIMKCETARALKLCSQGGMSTVEPLSFIVPRKSEAFQVILLLLLILRILLLLLLRARRSRTTSSRRRSWASRARPPTSGSRARTSRP